MEDYVQGLFYDIKPNMFFFISLCHLKVIDNLCSILGAVVLSDAVLHFYL